MDNKRTKSVPGSLLVLVISDLINKIGYYECQQRPWDNDRLTSVSLSLALSPLMFSYGEKIRRRTQAQAVSHTKQAKSALSLQVLHAHLALKLENAVHVTSGYPRACLHADSCYM